MTDANDIETDDLEAEESNGEQEEASRPETAEETARAVWRELSEKAANEDDRHANDDDFKPKEEKPAEEEEEKPNEISEAARKLASAKRIKKRQTFVPVEDAQQGEKPQKLEPPNGWEVEHKEWFNKQDPVVQKEALRWFQNAQGRTTRVWQELNQQLAEVKEVKEVADKYISKLNVGNFTKGQVVEQLFKFQERINEDDEGAILEMMQHRGITLEHLQKRLQGGQAPQPRPVQQQPQNNNLTPAELERYLEQREQRLAQSRASQSATEEVSSLMRETDANGNYLYRELHDPVYIQRIQPLVTYFRDSNPGISWGEIYKRAVLQDRFARGVPTAPVSPRLTPEDIKTVKQASSSLRSRGGNGAIPRMADPKPNESHRETAEACYWHVFGNKQH